MPHITLETSGNLKMDFQAYFKRLSDVLVESGHASRMGIKCRVVSSDTYYIIDGNPEYKMINVLFRLREGRSVDTLRFIAKATMDLLEEFLTEDIAEGKVILSTEIKELIKGQDLTENSVRKREGKSKKPE